MRAEHSRFPERTKTEYYLHAEQIEGGAREGYERLGDEDTPGIIDLCRDKLALHQSFEGIRQNGRVWEYSIVVREVGPYETLSLPPRGPDLSDTVQSERDALDDQILNGDLS